MRLFNKNLCFLNNCSKDAFRILGYFLLFGLLLIEPVYANKFETIGGGVSGANASKLSILKEIALYAGGFLLFLGLASLVTRNRFEGLIGVRSKNKKFELVLVTPILLMVAGGILLLIHFT